MKYLIAAALLFASAAHAQVENICKMEPDAVRARTHAERMIDLLDDSDVSRK
jgi:hypothetical protein